MPSMKASILVVDDEEMVRRLISRTVEVYGYTTSQASDAADARKQLKAQNFDLVISDVNMPGESGIDLALYIASHYVDTALIMVTAVDDPKIAEVAMQAGIYGYFTKPFNHQEVAINVRNALHRRDLEIVNRNYREGLERLVEERTTGLRSALEGIVLAMSRAIEFRDPYTSGHQRRVATLCAAMAKEMDLTEDQTQGMRLAATIHDLGKMGVPAEILSKPARLSEIEFSLIKEHPKNGYDILKDIVFPWPIAEIVFQHHERMDGSGYPRGLRGDEILPEVRILAVADVVEAMASHRPYRSALGLEKALEEISRNAGTLYEPEITEACKRLFTQLGFTFERQ